MKLFTLIFALVYFLFPIDVVPDYLFPWGYIDDALIAGVLWKAVNGYLAMKKRPRRPDPSGENKQDQPKNGPGKKEQIRDPHEVLGVEKGAGPEKIREAYRRKVGKYHPDRVQHLGEEFRKLAEEKFKEIQRAYDQIK